VWRKNEHDSGKGVVSVAVQQQLLGSHRLPLSAGPGRRQRALISTRLSLSSVRNLAANISRSRDPFRPMLTTSIATSGRAENGRRGGGAEMATTWRVDLSPIRISSLAKLKRELYNQTHTEGSEQREEEEERYRKERGERETGGKGGRSKRPCRPSDGPSDRRP
jgi:hypothetical protein